MGKCAIHSGGMQCGPGWMRFVSRLGGRSKNESHRLWWALNAKLWSLHFICWEWGTTADSSVYMEQDGFGSSVLR